MHVRQGQRIRMPFHCGDVPVHAAPGKRGRLIRLQVQGQVPARSTRMACRLKEDTASERGASMECEQATQQGWDPAGSSGIQDHGRGMASAWHINVINTYLVFQGDRRGNCEQQIGQLDKPEEGCVNTHDTYTILRTALG